MKICCCSHAQYHYDVMMLDFLGEKDSAVFLDDAINQVLAGASAPHTPDIGGQQAQAK